MIATTDMHCAKNKATTEQPIYRRGRSARTAETPNALANYKCTAADGLGTFEWNPVRHS